MKFKVVEVIFNSSFSELHNEDQIEVFYVFFQFNLVFENIIESHKKVFWSLTNSFLKNFRFN